MMSNESVVRHSLVVRLCHWIIAVSGLFLTFSGIGFMPLYGRFYLNDLPGMGWVSNFSIQMVLHYSSAGLFVAACLFHIVYHWRKKEFSLLPRRGDMAESWLIIKALFTKGDEPPHDKFLAEQRLAYAAFAMTILVLMISGYFLAFKNAAGLVLDPTLIQVVTLSHMGFTFLFLMQVLVHLAAFMLRVNRPLFPSMWTGRVARSYATERHPVWTDKSLR